MRKKCSEPIRFGGAGNTKLYELRFKEMKLPVRFDEERGSIYDSENNLICHVLYHLRDIDDQKQDMRDIVEAVNSRTVTDGQGKDVVREDPAVPVEEKP